MNAEQYSLKSVELLGSAKAMLQNFHNYHAQFGEVVQDINGVFHYADGAWRSHHGEMNEGIGRCSNPSNLQQAERILTYWQVREEKAVSDFKLLKDQMQDTPSNDPDNDPRFEKLIQLRDIVREVREQKEVHQKAHNCLNPLYIAPEVREQMAAAQAQESMKRAEFKKRVDEVRL